MSKDLILKKGDTIYYKGEYGSGTITVADGLNGETISTFERAHGYQVTKVERPTNYKKIYEAREILDDKEKEYLSYVIRPFRERIIYSKMWG